MPSGGQNAGGQNAEKSLSGAQKPPDPLPTTAFPKQQRQAQWPRSRPDGQAPRGLERRALRLPRENRVGISPDCSLLGRGYPGNGLLDAPVETRGWVEQPRRGPGVLGGAEALSYLPAGIRCAGSSAPGPAASSWAQIRPVWSSWGQRRLEIISR